MLCVCAHLHLRTIGKTKVQRDNNFSKKNEKWRKLFPLINFFKVQLDDDVRCFDQKSVALVLSKWLQSMYARL